MVYYDVASCCHVNAFLCVADDFGIALDVKHVGFAFAVDDGHDVLAVVLACDYVYALVCAELCLAALGITSLP